MWQNFQETALSLERISDIIDNPKEIEIIGKDLPQYLQMGKLNLIM